jgi:hypothetical protein
MKIHATLNTRPLEQTLERLGKQIARRGLTRSFSKAVRVMKTEARREVQNRLNLPV